MNATVASLTSRSLLGRRRVVVLLLLPLALLSLCTLARVLGGLDADIENELDTTLAPDLLGAFGIVILMPLLSLIAGTGSIGPEIEDGSIVYLLAKPLNRYSIIVAKLAVAIGVVIAFGVAPIAIAGVAYAAVFLVLSVVTRNAVVVGLIYALIWESLVGGLVPGAQTLSIQQWSIAIVEQVMGESADRLGVASAVSFGVGLVLLVVVTIAATCYAGRRLQTLRINEQV